jgi:hypothetical protein
MEIKINIYMQLRQELLINIKIGINHKDEKPININAYIIMQHVI